jgi:hypothetical protein
MAPKKLIRSEQFLGYFIGGGTCILAVGLLLACAYNGMWDDDNYWRNYQLGRRATVHNLAVTLIVLAIVALLGLIGAVALRLRYPLQRVLRLICFAIAFVLTLAIIIVQGVALTLTTYADYHVSSEYGYYDTSSEFKEYYDKYATPDMETFGSLESAVHPELNRLLADQNFTTTIPYADLDWSEYYQEYANTSVTPPNNNAKIAPCVFDWVALSSDTTRFLGGDPCMFSIGDNDALACIGSWTGTNFQRYWCYASRTHEIDVKYASDHSFADVQKRMVRRVVGITAVDSMSAFYRHNTYCIGILVASFVVSVIAVVIDHLFFAPKPTPAADAAVPA